MENHLSNTGIVESHGEPLQFLHNTMKKLYHPKPKETQGRHF